MTTKLHDHTWFCAPRLLGMDGAQGMADLVNPFPERQKAFPNPAEHPKISALTLVPLTIRGPWRVYPGPDCVCCRELFILTLILDGE